MFPKKWRTELALKRNFDTDLLLRNNPISLPITGMDSHLLEDRASLTPKEKLYERLIASQARELEAKEKEIELLKKCHSKNSDNPGNGEADMDGFEPKPSKSESDDGGDPINIPTHV